MEGTNLVATGESENSVRIRVVGKRVRGKKDNGVLLGGSMDGSWEGIRNGFVRSRWLPVWSP